MSDPEQDPTGVFERMYLAAAHGGEAVPWDRGGPHPLVEAWARDADGRGRRAVVVGAGLGADAELLAARDFAVVAFDVSPTAVATARERFPGSTVDYRVANLLGLPEELLGAFDLVVESLTVQSMPRSAREAATAAVASLVGPGGTLLVVATAHDGDFDGPPWPLTRAEVEAFAQGGVEVVRIEDVREPGLPARWRAEFRRGA